MIPISNHNIINSKNIGRVSTNHHVEGLKNMVEDIVANLSDEGTKKRCLRLYKDMFSPKKAVEKIINGLV